MELIALPTLGFLFVIFLFCLIVSFMPRNNNDNGSENDN